MQNIIRCPVCGKPLKSGIICSGCGYDLARDYEVYPTLGIIRQRITSVAAKRQGYEKQQLREELDKMLQPLRIHQEESVRRAEEAMGLMRKELDELKQKLSMLEPHIEEGSDPSKVASASASKPHPALITIYNNTCTFGSYPQDADGTVRPILWQVLEVDKANDKALLISKNALDCQPYNTIRTDVTWETCTLRKWLNSTFLSTAFSRKEQEMILKVTVRADSDPDCTIDQGNSTEDQIFLLSILEAEKYFSFNEERRCAPTAYAVGRGAKIDDEYRQDGRAAGFWRLRSVGRYGVAHIYSSGTVSTGGYHADFAFIGVRPALWVNLESVNR